MSGPNRGGFGQQGQGGQGTYQGSYPLEISADNTYGGQVPSQPSQPVFPQLNIQLVPQMLPGTGFSVGEFNSLVRDNPPFRDVPSVFIAHLVNPNSSTPEPDWSDLLSHFVSPMARHGLANLQDLYLLVVRVVIPNLILQNRTHLYHVYQRHPDYPAENNLRYDSWDRSEQGQHDPNQVPVIVPTDVDPRFILPLNYTANISPRPIFRSVPTPDGGRFVQWLNVSQENLPGQVLPPQMRHRPTELDHHLAVPEVAVRAWAIGDLTRMTARVLRIFWWLMRNNSELRRLLQQA